MQFKNDTSVFTADGQEVGQIDRVVLDPRTKEVTHVVIREGLLLTTDKVVPLDLIAKADEDHIILQTETVEALPDFEEHHFITLDGEELPPSYLPEHAAPMYWYPFGAEQGVRQYVRHPHQPYIIETERNIPQQTVAVKEGAKVMSADGEHVGNIERVFVDPDTDRVTTFLVSKGLVLKERMFVPKAWVADFGEREVQLAVSAKLLEKQSRLIETWHELEELANELG